MSPLAASVPLLLCLALAGRALAQGQPGQMLPAVPPPPGTAPSQPAFAPLSAAPVAPVQAADWLPLPRVELRLIDKVMARTTTLAGRVDEPLAAGPLSVTVRHCLVRPTDRAPDAAAFLEIGETGKPPGYRSWQLVSTPAISVFDHWRYDIRIAACRP